MATGDLVYVQTREGRGYKMSKAKADAYVKRYPSATIIDGDAVSVQTETDEGSAGSGDDETKKSGKGKKAES